MAIFGLCGVKLLFIYNIFATLFYLYHEFVSARKGRFLLIYLSPMIEILFHSGLASILLGADYGFMVYTIALIPVAFYLPYTMPQYSKNIKLPLLSSCLIVIHYIVFSIITFLRPPLFTMPISRFIQIFLFCLNNMIAVALLLGFSILFMIEIDYMQTQLEKENQSLGKIANFDSLTHLLNRHSMNSYMSKVWDKALNGKETFSLIMADLDEFKKRCCGHR